MKTSNFVFSKVVLEFGSKKELRDYFFALNSALVQFYQYRDKECVETFQKDLAQKQIDLLVELQNALNPVSVYGVEE